MVGGMRLLDLLTSVDDRSTVARHVDEDLEARIRRLEEDNQRLREVLRVVVQALEDRGIVATHGNEVEVARAPAVPRATGAKFACARCGTLYGEPELTRIDGVFVCRDC